MPTKLENLSGPGEWSGPGGLPARIEGREKNEERFQRCVRTSDSLICLEMMLRMALHNFLRGNAFRGPRYTNLFIHLVVKRRRTIFPYSIQIIDRPHFPLTADIAKQRGAR